MVGLGFQAGGVKSTWHSLWLLWIWNLYAHLVHFKTTSSPNENLTRCLSGYVLQTHTVRICMCAHACVHTHPHPHTPHTHNIIYTWACGEIVYMRMHQTHKYVIMPKTYPIHNIMYAYTLTQTYTHTYPWNQDAEMDITCKHVANN